MPRFTVTAMSCLRASLLVLLVLGVVIRPALNQIGGLHTISHAALVTDAGATDDGHGAFNPADTDADPGHVAGSHSLMHMADGGASIWISTDWIMASSILPPTGLQVHVTNQPPSHRLVSPFRPPIA